MGKRAKAAARAAAKRIPLVGTAVVVAPAIEAISRSGLSLSNLTDKGAWANALKELSAQYTGMNNGQFYSQRLLETYGPIAAYLIARRFAGRHISRVLRPLKLKF